MKKVLILLVLAFVAYSCASTKKSAKAVDISLGAWDYVVSGTPEGEVTGVMTLTKEGEVYAGNLATSQGSLPLENITVTDNNLKCTFNYMGYNVDVTGLFEGDAFTGKCTVEYNDFPMKATRKKE